MNDLMNKLSEFGTIRTCKRVNDDVFTLIITDGFKEDLNSVSSVFSLVQKSNPDLEIAETVISEDNFCVIVLKRKTD